MNYREILGVTIHSTDEEVRQAYQRLRSKYHPDRPGGDGNKFNEVLLAYKYLTKQPCSLCNGKGKVRNTFRGIVRVEMCPRCWP